MDECNDYVGSEKFVSKFDLLKGYWQVHTKKAQQISAFVRPSGLYSQKVKPFVLCSAPATLQCLINKVFGDLNGCALDDIVIYRDSWDHHLLCICSLFNIWLLHT